ncbi:MAG: hypothetical protein OXF78_11730 [Rhodospirillales bacterium]|nr:hypothetical protein [Rhodospirillales bacterium]
MYFPASLDADKNVHGMLRQSIAEAAANAVVKISVNAFLDARDAAREAGVEAAMRTLANRLKTPIGVDDCKQGWLAVDDGPGVAH